MSDFGFSVQDSSQTTAQSSQSLVIPNLTARVILLGASNLTRCLPGAVANVRNTLGGPLDIFIVAGHGRSYGTWSRVLSRGLPGILQSAVWPALRDAQNRNPLPTFALITDIGNDIMYGETAESIAAWIEQCITHLEQLGARIVITQLPMDSIRAVGPKRFAIVKSILFPTRDINFKTAMEQAQGVAAALAEIALQPNVSLIEQRKEWFGFDPIHIKPRWKSAALRSFCSGWSENAPARCIHPTMPDTVRLRLATPHEWSLFGMPRHRTQPSVTLRDFGRLHFY